MVDNFYNDLARGQAAELIVRDILASFPTAYWFKWVGAEKEYRHKGDIIATSFDGSKTFIEVKDDTVIGTTGNVLCEE